MANELNYNRLAGESVPRIAALSDGIFAVAMTLLVLDVHVPARAAIHNEAQLWHGLGMLAPQFVTYLMSFLTLAIFWNGQQTQLNRFSRSDRHLTWIHMAFLFTVTLVPFSTRLLADYITSPTALVWYWGNVLLLGATLFVSWRYARRVKLLEDDSDESTICAIERRIVIAQTLYAFGAALCVFSTYASIGFIVAVQLFFALGLKLGRLSRI